VNAIMSYGDHNVQCFHLMDSEKDLHVLKLFSLKLEVVTNQRQPRRNPLPPAEICILTRLLFAIASVATVSYIENNINSLRFNFTPTPVKRI